MRTFLIASAAVAAMAAVPASAQTVVRHGGNGGGNTGGGWVGGGWVGGGGGWGGGTATASAQGGQGGSGGWSGGRGGSWNNGGGWNGQHWGGGRWGGNVSGRWYGGMRAPGGWKAYRRPYRGSAMSVYWQSPAWAINDWQFYGLQAPPAGYGWSRYYDDAVLMDQRGYVYDSVSGLDWSRDGRDGDGYYDGPRGQYNGIDPRCYEVSRKRKGSGLGGAIVGGALGVAVGAATGGTGAMLLGGGLGALGGQAIDRESRERKVICDRAAQYGPGYGNGGYANGNYAYSQGGYAQNYGYGYQGYAQGAVTTATVEFDAPVTTTTTTTTVTEEWVYPKKVVRKAVAKKKWRPAPKVKSKLIRCSC